MGAALLAPGKALVDAITVSLIGNNENAAVGESGRRGEQQRAGNECGGKSHGGHRQWKRGPPISNNAKVLIMINHERVAGDLAANLVQIRAQAGLDGVPRAGTWWNHERFPRHLQHLPRDY